MLNIGGDINSDQGLKKLDEYLATRSYIEGYIPTQSDIILYEALKSVSAKYEHASRWYTHIKSYQSEKNKLPGLKKSLQDYGVTGGGGKPAAKDDDDDIDLFGSDEEPDEEAEKAREERLKAYAEKKAKKPGTIAKSNVVLDVKPWDDETDMKAMEQNVRSIEMDGLKWGASKLVPLAYGIKKLQIVCVVEDDKVSIEELSEKIEAFEDFVQSVDVAAFQKI
ncbi:elongation factor 1-beta-like protein [Dermatophagoides farinae]|uniref:Elongation factor 1-beta-like protein n=1 Tax=Dermatophagoides farinae TaxID=6954 RepID=A0A9D4PAV3_DERFA|nr:elongation factor 1-beta-like [Dermatophagoides farinae]KAH7646624.1 elongation factor 1-beta-like protein [Dermatophagoides farinae]